MLEAFWKGFSDPEIWEAFGSICAIGIPIIIFVAVVGYLSFCYENSKPF